MHSAFWTRRWTWRARWVIIGMRLQAWFGLVFPPRGHSGPCRPNNRVVVHHAPLAGYGIAFLPLLSIADDLRAARLCRVLADYPSEPTQTFLVYPSRRHLAPRTRVVIDFLVKQIGLVRR